MRAATMDAGTARALAIPANTRGEAVVATLRRVFTTRDAAGKEHFDAAGWEGAIQQVLAACKEFKVACGYPARESDIEMRMRQGFSVFIMGWGDEGFRTVELGRRLSGRGASGAGQR